MNKARLVVVLLSVAAGGVAAYLASGEKSEKIVQAPVAQVETIEILTATRDIEVGQRLLTQDFDWQPWPAKSVSDQFVRQSADAKQRIVGAIARSPFAAGEPIREAKLIKANGSGYLAAMLPTGMRAIATEITAESSAAGFILPNDRVDVILTSAQKEGGKENYKSKTVLKNVRVLAIDQNIEEKNGQKVVIGKIATLELNQVNAEKLALARRLGNLSLVLRSLLDQSVADDADATSLQSPEINVVRYGRSSTQ